MLRLKQSRFDFIPFGPPRGLRLEAMVTALLIKCPDDPCEFMMKAVSATRIFCLTS